MSFLCLTKYICQPEDKYEGTPARPRLILRERDRDFFEEYIQNSDGIKKIGSTEPVM